jgi:hypothetical protein
MTTNVRPAPARSEAVGNPGRPGPTLDDYLYWQERLEGHGASGLSIDEFCPSSKPGSIRMSNPGDGDYGLLYMTHGDSNVKTSPNDDPQHLGNVLGKMIRIDPLQSGANRYTVPPTNPFAGVNDPGVLKDVYAYGFRNPHTFSFNR